MDGASVVPNEDGTFRIVSPDGEVITESAVAYSFSEGNIIQNEDGTFSMVNENGEKITFHTFTGTQSGSMSINGAEGTYQVGTFEGSSEIFSGMTGDSYVTSLNGSGQGVLISAAYESSVSITDAECGLALQLQPASFSTTSDGAITEDAMLYLPVYGADGGVENVIPAGCQNETAGLRAVSTQSGEVCGFVLDLGFRSGKQDATLSLCMGDASTMTFTLRDGADESAVKNLLGALRVVFYDSETKAYLNTAEANVQNATLANGTITVTLGAGDALALTAMGEDAECSVSLLVCLDFDDVSAAAAADVSLIRTMSFDLTFTD